MVGKLSIEIGSHLAGTELSRKLLRDQALEEAMSKGTCTSSFSSLPDDAVTQQVLGVLCPRPIL